MELNESETNEFKNLLIEFSKLFEEKEFNKNETKALKEKLHKFDKNKALKCWLNLFESKMPVEDLGNGKYEIYDVNNFLTKEDNESENYVHKLEISTSDDTGAIFMKFYFVFYCINNGLKSSDYNIQYSKGGWM